MPRARSKAIHLLKRAEEIRNNIEGLQVTLQNVRLSPCEALPPSLFHCSLFSTKLTDDDFVSRALKKKTLELRVLKTKLRTKK